MTKKSRNNQNNQKNRKNSKNRKTSVSYPGVITVMMSLTLTILLSVVLAVLTAIRFQSMRLVTEVTADMGLDSCYAEYHRELLSQYGLLFIDDSYGSANAALDNTSKHLFDYVEKSLSSESIITLDRLWNPAQLRIENVMIGDASIATDHAGSVFKRQAINYTKDKYGIAYLEMLKDQSQTVSGSGYEATHLSEDVKQNSKKAQDLADEENKRRKAAYDAAMGDYNAKMDAYDPEEGGSPPTPPSPPQYVSLDNQATKVDTSDSLVLATILSSQSDLSNAAYDLSLCASERELYGGIGLIKEKADFNPLIDDVLFGEYIMEKYGNFIKNTEEDYFKYQVEYVIAGKESDRKNLEAVAIRLLAVRGGANLAVLVKSPAKVAQADTAAAAACAAFPTAQPFVKAALIAAWAYAESALDLNVLLSGGKIPLIKTDADWQLSFADMFHYKDFFGVKKGNEGGLTYTAYLRVFLLLTADEKKTMRAIDMIEMDMRKTPGNKNFRMDACLDYCIAALEYSSPLGYHFTIERAYAYE